MILLGRIPGDALSIIGWVDRTVGNSPLANPLYRGLLLR